MTKARHLTETFVSLQTKFKKGTSTHIKEIFVFQRYFETVYNPRDLHRTIFEATATLKEKLIEKIPRLKFPPYVKDKYIFSLFFYI